VTPNKGMRTGALGRGSPFERGSAPEGELVAPRRTRISIARWNIDLHSGEAGRIVLQIDTEGAAVFRAQPGFVRSPPVLGGPKRRVG
jgi:hypothetical protein